MGLALVVIAAALVALPAVSRRLGSRFAPREWARLCLVALAAGGVLFELGAVLYALPTVLRAINAPVLADACERMLGGLTPGGRPAGWAAALVAVTAGLLAGGGVLRGRRIARSVRIEPGLFEHRCCEGVDVAVLPTDAVLAVAVDGANPQIVVSQGIVKRLSVAQFEVMLLHEAAHLRLRHQRYMTVAAAVEHGLAFLPLVRRSTASLRAALERCADEAAAGADPARRTTLRDAIVAVAVTGGALSAPRLAAFSAADAILERLGALERPPVAASRPLRAALYSPGLALGATACVALGAWIGGGRMVLAMAGHCAM